MTKTFCDRCHAEGPVRIMEVYVRQKDDVVGIARAPYVSIEACAPCVDYLVKEMRPSPAIGRWQTV